MTQNFRINVGRVMSRLHELAAINPLRPTGSCRPALSDEDKRGRDLLVGWLKAAGLAVHIDAIGNIFGVLEGSDPNLAPIMSGSHIDTVATGGLYDGALGVVGALEVAETLRRTEVGIKRSLVVAAFTNEEGARFQPDMLGSHVYTGGMSVAEGRATIGIDGKQLGAELDRIGYAGEMVPGAIRPAAFVELHIEQGPILDAEGVAIGAVENLQGISWQEVTFTGHSNHAGTTPMHMRHDCAAALGEVIVFLGRLASEIGGGQVATVGRIELEPNLVNVVPGLARFTIDIRNPDANLLREAEARVASFLQTVARGHGLESSTRELARFEPVRFDERLVSRIERNATALGLSNRRMTSGAGHDAQMMATICPTAMIFAPSIGGISHNPNEATAADDIEDAANVLLHTLAELLTSEGEIT